MDTLATLVKKHKLDKICLIGTWIIAILGIGHIASESYVLWQTYNQELINSSQLSQIAYSPLNTVFINDLPSIIAIAASYIFYCLVLYSASVIFHALSARAPEERKTSDAFDEHDLDDGSIVYTRLKRDEILQSKKAAQ